MPHLGAGALPWNTPQASAQAGSEAASEAADVWFARGKPRPQALELLEALRRAGEHGLDPADYHTEEIARALSSRELSYRERGDAVRASALLSQALAAYARDLRISRQTETVFYVDEGLIPTAPDPAGLLASGTLKERLVSLHAENLPYENLRAALAQYRATWGRLPDLAVPAGMALAPGARDDRVIALRQRLGVAESTADARLFDAALGEKVRAFRAAHGLGDQPVADSATIAALNRGAAHYEGIILANLDRVRGLPADGSRYVLVDTAAAQVHLIEDGRETGTMRAVVGKPGMETPMMAALIRHAVVNPYWNVPPDLVRHTVAPAVLREGHGALARRRFVLSPDWRSETRLDPREVDWQGVATGREQVWVRQLPGGGNMMGKVKFMLPNDLGIYLHDTPNKSLFRREDRRLSSGCVRIEDPARLARWLFQRERVLEDHSGIDQRVDLAEPVPVFITHLTVTFEDGRVRFRPETEAQARHVPNIARSRS